MTILLKIRLQKKGIKFLVINKPCNRKKYLYPIVLRPQN